jgi:hypothetical protein
MKIVDYASLTEEQQKRIVEMEHRILSRILSGYEAKEEDEEEGV